MIWRMPKEEFDPKYTVPTAKHTGGKCQVFGLFLNHWCRHSGFHRWKYDRQHVSRYFRKEFIQISEKTEFGQ